MTLFSYRIFFLIGISLLINTVFYSISHAAEEVPDDVRYMLEDMYGANKKEWPLLRYKQDLNKDGFSDWIVKKKKCQSNKNCAAELFICIPNKKGKCSEYCYIEVKTLINVEENLNTLKCESTC